MHEFEADLLRRTQMEHTFVYQGRTYRGWQAPYGQKLIQWSEGADPKRAVPLPYNAVPPCVRAALLTQITGRPYVVK